jgi:hypothetical protein
MKMGDIEFQKISTIPGPEKGHSVPEFAVSKNPRKLLTGEEVISTEIETILQTYNHIPNLSEDFLNYINKIEQRKNFQ